MKTQQILDMFTYFMIALIFIGGIQGVYLNKKLCVSLKYMVVLLLIAGITELSGQLLIHFNRNSTSIFNLYILVEFILLMAAAGYWVLKGRFTKIVVASIIIYSVIWGIYMMHNGWGMFITRVFLFGCIILSCNYLYVIFCIARISDYPSRLPFFWIALGTIIYFGGCIPLFSMFDYFKSHEKVKLGSYLYTINDILAIIRYLLTIYGFSLLKKGKVLE